MDASPDQHLPPLPIRVVGRSLSAAIARAPWLWPVMRRPTRGFWEHMAGQWDARVEPDSAAHLAPLAAACDHVEIEPDTILELGTGTGSGALMLARRFPGATVSAVDISAAMIEAARAKASGPLAERMRFAVADASALPYESETFDLVAQLNVPAYFDETARVLRPGGYVIVASTFGPATPYYTPDRLLRRGFAGRGLEPAGAGRAGSGSYVLARRPATGGT